MKLFWKKVLCFLIDHRWQLINPRIRAAYCPRCKRHGWPGDNYFKKVLAALALLALAAPGRATAQTTAPIPGYSHVDGLVAAKITDGAASVSLTGTSLNVNCTAGCGAAAANATVNVTQFGGTNVSTGTGASGAGIPRVTVANDSNVLATQSGAWTVAANAGTNLNTSALALEAGGNLASIKADVDKIPTSPATDRATAGGPFSVEISDGSAFYVGAKTGQLPSALGQAAMAGSVSVAVASDQPALAVTMQPPKLLNPLTPRCNAVRQTNCR